MLIWDDGLILAKANLAVDFCRPQNCAFVSHAHADHYAKHQMALCTPETATLYLHRIAAGRSGKSPKKQTAGLVASKHRIKEMPFGQTIEWGGLHLTTYPAGHCLGSAMLHVRDSDTGETLLYTGDFKIGPSQTAGTIEIPQADILIMESTFGTPKHRLPPRDEVINEFLSLIRRTLELGETPVVFAYALGKSQEITRILLDAGINVQQHESIFEISEIYERHGVNLGIKNGQLIPLRADQRAVEDRVLIVPPRYRFETRRNSTTFAVTGWAVESGAIYRFGVDYALPLSDHADYDELLEMVRRVQPKTTYCTHGPVKFVDHLNELGFNARPIDRPWQGHFSFDDDSDDEK